MILNRILDLFKKDSSPDSKDHPKGDSPADEALKAVEADQEKVLNQLGPDRPRPGLPGSFTAMLIGAALVAGGVGVAAGRFLGGGSCTVNRPGVLITRDGQQWTGILASLDGGGAFFKKGEEGKSDRFEFNSISRIIFFRDREEQQSQSVDSLGSAGALGYFPGAYDIESGGHKGELSIFFTPAGLMNGSVRFVNWGSRQPEYLTGMRVLGNRIDFRRACAGQECRRIGSPYDFRQDYIGYIDMARKEIKGTYSGTHSSGTWVARRRQ